MNNPVEVNIVCRICKNEFVLTVDLKDYDEYVKGKGYIQEIFHYLSPDERELIQSRTCGGCFDKMFEEED